MGVYVVPYRAYFTRAVTLPCSLYPSVIDRLYFACPGSILSRLDHHQQALAYLISLTRSLVVFLHSCGFALATPSLPLNRSASSDSAFEFGEQEIVASFVDLIASDLGRFVLERANLLYAKEFEVAIEESDSSPHSVAIDFPPMAAGTGVVLQSDCTPALPTTASIDALVASMVDDLVKCAEEIGSLSPRSAKYIFMTPRIVRQGIKVHFFDGAGCRLGSVERDGSDIDGEDAVEQIQGTRNGGKFKDLFEDFGRKDTSTIKQRRLSTAAQRFSNCIELLSEFDSRRLMKALQHHFNPASVLKPSTLTHSAGNAYDATSPVLTGTSMWLDGATQEHSSSERSYRIR